MIKPGDLTPGISALEYYERRMRLCSKMPSNSVAILPGEDVKIASGAVFYPFQQATDMFYFTGWNEPDSVAIIEKPSDNPEDAVFHMFVPKKDPHAEQWEGHRTGVNGVRDIFNADESDGIDQLKSHLSKILLRNKTVFYESKSSQSWLDIFKGSKSTHSTIEQLFHHNNVNPRSLKPISSSLRAIKSPSEVKVMRKAGQISGRAYNQAYAHRFQTERTLSAFLQYQFVLGGCDQSAYVPVVAGGTNSLSIHYTRNDDLLHNDELVLVDAAGSLGGYCADISRTWPVSGKFTQPQRDLYQAVLNVEKKCIEKCSENQSYSLHDLHNESIQLMTSELRNCGFHDLQQWQTMQLYPHYIGHNLGLDVHDVPEFSRTAAFKEGQVVTVEPGVYVPSSSKWPKHFHNIGIRIEDDVCVHKDTCQILTVEAAKEIVDIESIAENGVTTPFPEVVEIDL